MCRRHRNSGRGARGARRRRTPSSSPAAPRGPTHRAWRRPSSSRATRRASRRPRSLGVRALLAALGKSLGMEDELAAEAAPRADADAAPTPTPSLELLLALGCAHLAPGAAGLAELRALGEAALAPALAGLKLGPRQRLRGALRAPPTAARRPRILCLHGNGTCGDILRRQTAALWAQLDADCTFLDGDLPTVASDPAISEYFPGLPQLSLRDAEQAAGGGRRDRGRRHVRRPRGRARADCGGGRRRGRAVRRRRRLLAGRQPRRRAGGEARGREEAAPLRRRLLRLAVWLGGAAPRAVCRAARDARPPRPRREGHALSRAALRGPRRPLPRRRGRHRRAHRRPPAAAVGAAGECRPLPAGRAVCGGGEVAGWPGG